MGVLTAKGYIGPLKDYIQVPTAAPHACIPAAEPAMQHC